MKTTILIIAMFFFLVPCYAQEKITEPAVEQKCKELFVKLKVILETEQNYAKKNNLSISELGKYAAVQLIKQNYVKNFRFDDIKETCMYNFACHLSASDYSIKEYAVPPDFLKFEGMKPVLTYTHPIPDVNMYKLVCCKPVGFIKTEDPNLKISCADYMKYFNSAMTTISKHLGYIYSTWQDGDTAYTTIASY